MKEQIILFETAKLAKEKGFVMLNYTNAYNVFRENLKKSGEGLVTTEAEEKPHYGGVSCVLRTFYQSKHWTLAPTQSLLQKWLRDVHKIYIEISVQEAETIATWYWKIFTHRDSGKNLIWIKADSNGVKQESYEEALEKGLQEALKLIK